MLKRLRSCQDWSNPQTQGEGENAKRRRKAKHHREQPPDTGGELISCVSRRCHCRATPRHRGRTEPYPKNRGEQPSNPQTQGENSPARSSDGCHREQPPDTGGERERLGKRFLGLRATPRHRGRTPCSTLASAALTSNPQTQGENFFWCHAPIICDEQPPDTGGEL